MGRIGVGCCCDEECIDAVEPFVLCYLEDPSSGNNRFWYIIRDAKEAQLTIECPGEDPLIVSIELTDGDAEGYYVLPDNLCTICVTAINCQYVKTCCGVDPPPPSGDCCLEIEPQYVFLSFPDAVAEGVPYGCCGVFSGQYILEPTSNDSLFCRFTQARTFEYTDEEIIEDTEGLACYTLSDVTNPDGTQTIIRVFPASSRINVFIERASGVSYIEWLRKLLYATITIYPDPPGPPLPPPPTVNRSFRDDIWTALILGCQGGTVTDPIYGGTGGLVGAVTADPEWTFVCATPGSASPSIPAGYDPTPELRPQFQMVVLDL